MNAPVIVEVSRRPLVFRVTPPSKVAMLKAALPSGAEIRRMLADGIAALPDVPPELAASLANALSATRPAALWMMP